MAASMQRPADDFTRLKRTGQGVELPGGTLVRFTSQQPDATWELVNEYGISQKKVTEFKCLLEQNSYSRWAEQQTLGDLLKQATPRLRDLLRYSGALIEHLYLDARPVSLGQVDRAARLCHLLIQFWEQEATTAGKDPLPALWRSYREALSILVEARDNLLREIEHLTAQSERARAYRVLLGRAANVWLSGWHEIVDQQYQRAQREVAVRMSFRSVEIRIRALHPNSQAYPVELRVEGWSPPPDRAMQLPANLDINDTHAYGRALGELLFAETAIGSDYRESIPRIWHEGEYPRVRLRIDPPELEHMHWERIFHPWGGVWQPLAITYETPFSRIIEPETLTLSSGGVLQGPLRILVVIASPWDLGKWGQGQLAPITSTERQLYHDLFAGLRDVHADFLESKESQRPTLAELKAALSHGYNIVHMVCHGVRELSGEYRLLLEKESGHGALISDEELMAALGTTTTLPLLMLAACQSAQHSASADLIPLGQVLVKRGIADQAVAMNGRIGVETARHFTTAFYRQLAAHGFVDLAMNRARRAVRNSWDWDVPILFSR